MTDHEPGPAPPTGAAVPGPLLIISGPSGTGKSTVIRRLLEASPYPLRLSVSATTRAPRPGERDGVDYHFWDRGRFDTEVAAGGFLEWADVFGRRYGTLRSEVEPYRARGTGVVLDIDVQGAEQVRRHCPDHVSVFLQAPSLHTYEQRLRGRHTEDEDAIRRRLAAVERELAVANRYSYQVINDTVENAVAQLDAIVRRQFERK